MAIIDWPDALRPASVEWGLHWPQAVGRSAFDGSAQATTIGAPAWVFTVETGPMRLVEAPQWEAFVQRLRGMQNRARAWDWRREAPLGPATGTPVLSGAGSGASVLLSGWTPSVAGILLAGSWMGINGELKRLSADISSNGSGQATATFEPPLRATAPSGGAVTLVKPTAIFMLQTATPSLKQQGARLPGMTLQFREVFA